jgi:hypothetical protein
MSVNHGAFIGDVIHLFTVRYGRWVDLGGEFFAATDDDDDDDDDDDAGVASKPSAIANLRNSPPKCSWFGL